MTSEKSGRNKTINTSVKEGAIYLERCISVKEKQDSLDLVMDKTILGDSMQVCALLPENSVDLIIADPPYNLTKTFNALLFQKRRQLIMKLIQENGSVS